jgi:cytochrome c oxidase subunit III
MTARVGAPELDVSALPEHAFGQRAPLWWGVLLLVAIEATAMGLLLVSGLYLGGDTDIWPPTTVGPAAMRLAILEAALLAASYLPMVASVRAARRENLAGTRIWLVIATALGAIMLVIRAFEIPRVAFRWDTHAFGSVFWMVLGIHVTHVLTGVLENAMMIVLLFKGPVEKKHYGDVEAAALLWYFSILEWAPALAILYVMPAIKGGK